MSCIVTSNMGNRRLAGRLSSVFVRPGGRASQDRVRRHQERIKAAGLAAVLRAL